jgi:two-component system, NarL family, response regulator DesR
VPAARSRGSRSPPQVRPIREIARTVLLSPGTIRNYLAAITQKLDAGSRAKAYRIARDLGWI